MWKFIKEWRRKIRHKRAEKLRRRVKLAFLFEDAHEFFAGKKTREESLNYRQKIYAWIDEMSDDEILG